MAATMELNPVEIDPAAKARLDRLAACWGVSQAEALERALELAECGWGNCLRQAPTREEFVTMSPAEALDYLRDHPQVPPGWGEDFRRQLRADRERDAEIEEERAERRARAAAAIPHGSPA